MQDNMLDTLLSFLPVVLLIVLPLVSNIRLAAVVTFIVTGILFFIWQAPVPYFFASLVVAFFSTVQILMIVFGAVFLFEMLQSAGYIQAMNHSVEQLHSSRELRFFLVAIGLTAFFEGVAGFGTPGAIVPLLLISMGYHPLLSVACVLLFDGLFAAFGAVGTPLMAGLKVPLGLLEREVMESAVYASVLLVLAAVILLYFVARMYRKSEGEIKMKKWILLLYACALVPYVVSAFLFAELSTILASVVMLLVAVLIFYTKKSGADFRAWLPYGTLVILLLLPKLIAPLSLWLEWELRFSNLFHTSISAAIKPLRSPLLPFLMVAFIYTKEKKYYAKSFAKAGKKLLAVAWLLFPIVAVAQLMLSSGFSKLSMIDNIAQAFSQSGRAYAILAPFIGITGTFVTGSTTVSNIVFGFSHQQTAQLLSIDPALVYALQLSGASVGNAICLFNIIAACSVSNIEEPNKILLRNLLPVLVAGCVIGVAGWMLLYFFF